MYFHMLLLYITALVFLNNEMDTRVTFDAGRRESLKTTAFKALAVWANVRDIDRLSLFFICEDRRQRQA